MRIEFRCQCGKVLNAPASAAGRRAKCGSCGAVFLVPSVSPADVPKAMAGADRDDRRPAAPARRKPAPTAHAQAAANAEGELVAAFHTFRRKYSAGGWLGCSLWLAGIVAAVLAAIYIHWAVGVFGGIAVFVVTAGVFGTSIQRCEKQAEAAVREIEARHGIDKERSLALIWSPGGALGPNTSQFKPFVTAAWGRDAYQKMVGPSGDAKPAAPAPTADGTAETKGARTPKVLSHFACGHCHAPVTVDGAVIVCPKCKRKLKQQPNMSCPQCGSGVFPVWEKEIKGGTAGAIIGGLFLGGLGAALGKAMAGRQVSFCRCAQCHKRWGLELFE